MSDPLFTRGAHPLSARLGANARLARKRLGWTQTEVAQRLGISLMSYSRFETGQQTPALPRLAQLADILGIPFTSLLIGPDSGGVHAVAIAEALQDLPSDEQAFIYRIVMQCVQHWHARQLPPDAAPPADPAA